MCVRLALLLALLESAALISATPVSFNVQMPNVSPKTRDLYLCHKFKLDSEKPVYITEFHPNASKQTAHHMILFSCSDTPAEDIWDCGEMSHSKNSKLARGPVCLKSQSIIYAWAMDAPDLVLPKDVAFKLGGKNSNGYLVLQVHYANVDKFIDDTVTDNSGVTLKGQDEPVSKLAAVMLLATDGAVAAKSVEKFETACEIQDDIQMHPFAYRVHAHKLGVVNSGYVIKRGVSDAKHGRHTDDEWIELGRRSPQLPQMFYPVSNEVTIGKGDVVAARCTIKNYQNHDVFVGPTGDDEMCNFYIMYYVEGERTLSQDVCVTYGPPYWYLNLFKDSNGRRLDLSRMPSDISEVPEAKEDDSQTSHMMSIMSQQHSSEEKSAEKGGEVHKTNSNSNSNNRHPFDDADEDAEDFGKDSTESGENSSHEHETTDKYVERLSSLEKEFIYKSILAKLLDTQDHL